MFVLQFYSPGHGWYDHRKLTPNEVVPLQHGPSWFRARIVEWFQLSCGQWDCRILCQWPI